MDSDTVLQVSSNLMLFSRLRSSEDQVKYIPGDCVGQIYGWLKDYRVADHYLTPEQRLERDQYLVCLKCGRSCAGTCEGH